MAHVRGPGNRRDRRGPWRPGVFPPGTQRCLGRPARRRRESERLLRLRQRPKSGDHQYPPAKPEPGCPIGGGRQCTFGPDWGGAYLRDRLAANTAAPADLATAANSFATTIEQLGINYLTNATNDVQNPVRQTSTTKSTNSTRCANNRHSTPERSKTGADPPVMAPLIGGEVNGYFSCATRNRQSHNVLRRHRHMAGLGAAAGMFLAAAVIPLATTPVASGDMIDHISMVGGPAHFDPPGGDERRPRWNRRPRRQWRPGGRRRRPRWQWRCARRWRSARRRRGRPVPAAHLARGSARPTGLPANLAMPANPASRCRPSDRPTSASRSGMTHARRRTRRGR